MIPKLLAVLSTALLHSLAAAQPGELLRTPDCRAALLALSQEEDALIARRAAGAPGMTPSTTTSPSNLSRLQRMAAKACLGSADAAASGSAKRSPAPTPTPTPFSIPLPGVTRPGTAADGLVRPQAGRTPGTAPVRQAPLVTLGSCDTQGCWASDGTRVQRVGPMLLGPRGYCTQTGTVLNCP